MDREKFFMTRLVASPLDVTPWRKWPHLGDTRLAMSQENVEIVRRGFEHFLATGEPAWDMLHPDIEVCDHDIMDGLEYRGHADVRRWLFEDWAAAWSDWSAQAEEFIDAGDRVIAVFWVVATGRGSGVKLEREDAIVYAMRESKVARLDYYNSRDQALKAVGLDE